MVPSSVSVVLPPSLPTLFFTELIKDKLFENFNQLPSNPKEPEPEVDELDPDVPKLSKAVDNPEVEELLAPPPPHLSLHSVCSCKIKTSRYVESVSQEKSPVSIMMPALSFPGLIVSAPTWCRNPTIFIPPCKVSSLSPF